MLKIKSSKTNKLLQSWSNNPKKWIQSSELRRNLVEEYQHFICREDGLYWDSVTGKKYKEKPSPIYKWDTELYRDLDKLTEKGILENKKEPQKKGKSKSYYRLSEKYKFEPLKIWHQKSIDTCPMESILSSQGLTFYLANLSIKDDFTKEDIESIRFIATKIFLRFNDIDEALKKISEKKANRKWKVYVDNLEVSSETKLYLWLLFIGTVTMQHPSPRFLLNKCIDSINDELILNEKEIDKKLGKNYSITVSEKLLEFTKFLNDNIKDLTYSDLSLAYLPLLKFRAYHLSLFEEILKIWEKKANNFFKDLSLIFIQKKFGYSILDEVSEKISVEYKKHKKKYHKTIDQIIKILLDSKMYVTVKEPFFYLSEDLEEAYHLDRNQATEIILSDREVLDPFPKENIYTEMIKKSIGKYPQKFPEYKKREKKIFSNQLKKNNINFFRKNKYLDGFKDRLKELEYDEEELYKRLEEFANIFDMPNLPNKI